MAQKPRDYYEILGVSREADPVELKRAYRTLAMRYHPDQNQNDKQAEERFKEVSAAYAVLSDPEKRMRYDRLGHLGIGVGGAPGAADLGLDLDNVKEFFESIFGDLLGRKKGRSSGRDLRYTLEVTLREAALGTQKTISFPVRIQCTACHGSGGQGEQGLRVCRVCAGKGETRAPGLLPLKRPCATCHGTGKEVVEPCTGCRGNGQVEELREFVVNVPPGSEDGTTRRLSGQGEPGRQGGGTGDLTVTMRVKPHPLLTREGTLLKCDLPITVFEAALGAIIEVPTLEGRAEMRIPSGTQSGAVFRLRGKGVPAAKKGEGAGPRGDLHVKVFVETPHLEGESQRRAFIAMSEQVSMGLHPQRQKFDEQLRTIAPAGATTLPRDGSRPPRSSK